MISKSSTGMPRVVILLNDEVRLSPVVPGGAAARPSFSDEQVSIAQGPAARGRDTRDGRRSAAGTAWRRNPGARAHARVLGQARVFGTVRGGATAARSALVRGALAKIASCLGRYLDGGACGARRGTGRQLGRRHASCVRRSWRGILCAQ